MGVAELELEPRLILNHCTVPLLEGGIWADLGDGAAQWAFPRGIHSVILTCDSAVCFSWAFNLWKRPDLRVAGLNLGWGRSGPWRESALTPPPPMSALMSVISSWAGSLSVLPTSVSTICSMGWMVVEMKSIFHWLPNWNYKYVCDCCPFSCSQQTLLIDHRLFLRLSTKVPQYSIPSSLDQPVAGRVQIKALYKLSPQRIGTCLPLPL